MLHPDRNSAAQTPPMSLRFRQGSYEKDGETIYTTDLITEDFLLLAKHQPKSDANGDA